MQHAALLYEQQYQDFQSQMQRFDRRGLHSSKSPARSPSTKSFDTDDTVLRPSIGVLRSPSLSQNRTAAGASPTSPHSPSMLSNSGQKPFERLCKASLEEADSIRSNVSGTKKAGSAVEGNAMPSSPHLRTISSSSIRTLRQYDIASGKVSSTESSNTPVSTPLAPAALHLASPLRDSIIAAGDSTPSTTSTSDDEGKDETNDREALAQRLRDLQLMDLAAFLPNAASNSTAGQAQPILRTVRQPTVTALKTTASPAIITPDNPRNPTEEQQMHDKNAASKESVSSPEEASSPPVVSPELTSSNSSLRHPTLERIQGSDPTSPSHSRQQSPKPSAASSPQSVSAHNSVGSSFSDISDSSVTQSAMIDAMMSQNVNASKLSMWSRR